MNDGEAPRRYLAPQDPHGRVYQAIDGGCAVAQFTGDDAFNAACAWFRRTYKARPSVYNPSTGSFFMADYGEDGDPDERVPPRGDGPSELARLLGPE